MKKKIATATVSKKKKRDTAGKISRDLIINAPKLNHSAHEQMRENLTDFVEEIKLAVKAGEKKYDKDFYVIAIPKKERLMQNTMRMFYFTRKTCPTPDWDQFVYLYHRESDSIEFIWALPSRATCAMYRFNALTIDKSERELLDFVIAWDAGDLLRKAKRLNGEMDDSTLLA